MWCRAVIAPSPAAQFGKALVEKVGADQVTSIDQVDIYSLIQGPVALGVTEDGWCPCGKRAYLLLRCATCRDELAAEAGASIHPWCPPDIMEDEGESQGAIGAVAPRAGTRAIRS